MMPCKKVIEKKMLPYLFWDDLLNSGHVFWRALIFGVDCDANLINHRKMEHEGIQDLCRTSNPSDVENDVDLRET